MRGRVLITGGAGFIGSHLADALLERGHAVRALDSLTEQVHGPARARPDYLSPEVELQVGDVRDADAVARALEGVEAVFHLAAAVGVGQSMYEVAHYTSVNGVGTAVLMEALARRPVQRFVVASSMSLYGEGMYRRPGHSRVEVTERSAAQLAARRWEPDDGSGERLEPVPTPEEKRPSLASVYALTKYDQERLCLVLGQAYQVPTVALRFFNVYGPRQALGNPYTGVLAIFASRYLNGRPPLVNEDGRQRRDFVHVQDVVRACVAALDAREAPGGAYNVGSGRSHTVLEVAEKLARAMDVDVAPEVTGRYRVGDIRHCFADIARARQVLGYEPGVSFEEGLAALAGWLEGQLAEDRVVEAAQELASRGLAV